MRQERPILREDAEALARRLREAFDSGEDDIVVEWVGEPMRLKRVSEAEFLVQQADRPVATRVMLGSEVRPDGYPADFPYVPDEVVMLGTAEVPTMALWWSARDPAALFEAIERQCVAAGWSLRQDPSPPDASVTQRVYEKSGTMRYLTHSQGIVSLSQRK